MKRHGCKAKDNAKKVRDGDSQFFMALYEYLGHFSDDCKSSMADYGMGGENKCHNSMKAKPTRQMTGEGALLVGKSDKESLL